MSYAYTDQPYVVELLRHAEAETRAEPGRPIDVVVEHSSWCPILTGSGPCCCRPIVRAPNRAERRKLAKMRREPPAPPPRL